MRSHLLPLYVAVLFIHPVFAQTLDPSPGVKPGVVASAAGATLTLDEALARATDANPSLRAAAREVSAVEATILQARTRPNPELQGLVEDLRNETRVTTVQINQPIELGGKRGARIAVAEKNRSAAALALDVQRAEIRADVVTAFADVLAAQEGVRLAQATAELAQRASGVAARRVLAGRVSPVEETRARVAEANARLEAATAGYELTAARKRLAGLWGAAEPDFAQVQGNLESLPPLPPLAELNQQLETSPALLRARLEIERRHALAQVERSLRTPDVTVSLGARRNNELGLNQAVVGASLPLPLFNRNQGNILEAERRTDKARDELAAATVQAANSLAQAHARLDLARQSVTTLREQILPGAQSAYDAATRGFELGKFNFLDVLDAQRTLFQARAQYQRALAEAYRAAAEIERVLGGAIASAVPVDANLSTSRMKQESK